jgi:hypothetical protein
MTEPNPRRPCLRTSFPSVACGFLAIARLLGCQGNGRVPPHQIETLAKDAKDVTRSRHGELSEPRKETQESLPERDFEEASHYSANLLYPKILRRILPVAGVATRVSSSEIGTELIAKEDDWPALTDDFPSRKGMMILAGSDNGSILGFTYRYFVDINYPDPNIYGDSGDGPEFVWKHLTLSGDRSCIKRGRSDCKFTVVNLKPYKEGLRPTPSTALVRPIDHHDAALVYLHPETPIVIDKANLGLKEPYEDLVTEFRNDSIKVGFPFLFVSPESQEIFRDAVRRRERGADMLSFAVMVFLKQKLPQGIAGDIASALIESQITESLGGHFDLVPQTDNMGTPIQKMNLADEPRILGEYIYSSLSLPKGEFVIESENDVRSVHLLGVVWPEADLERNATNRYLKALTHGKDLVVAEFDSREGCIVFSPQDRLVINLELLRHGFTRLDAVDDTSILPEAVLAAALALESGTGFANDWSRDREYANKVRVHP